MTQFNPSTQSGKIKFGRIPHVLILASFAKSIFRQKLAANELNEYSAYLSQRVPLHVLYGPLLLLLLVLLQGVQVLLLQEGGAGVDGVMLQMGRRSSASVHRRPQAWLLHHIYGHGEENTRRSIQSIIECLPSNSWSYLFFLLIIYVNSNRICPIIVKMK